MNNSQHNSKKRKLGHVSNQQQEDEELLFGYLISCIIKLYLYSNGGNREAREDMMYRNMNDQEEEALEDDDAVLHEDGGQGSDEGEGDDLIEDMEQ